MKNIQQLVSEPCCINEGSHFHQNTFLKHKQKIQSKRRETTENLGQQLGIYNGLRINGEGIVSPLQCRLERCCPSAVLVPVRWSEQC